MTSNASPCTTIAVSVEPDAEHVRVCLDHADQVELTIARQHVDVIATFFTS